MADSVLMVHQPPSIRDVLYLLQALQPHAPERSVKDVSAQIMAAIQAAYASGYKDGVFDEHERHH